MPSKLIEFGQIFLTGVRHGFMPPQLKPTRLKRFESKIAHKYSQTLNSINAHKNVCSANALKTLNSANAPKIPEMNLNTMYDAI